MVARAREEEKEKEKENRQRKREADKVEIKSLISHLASGLTIESLR